MRILIAEDEELLAKGLKHLLEKSKYSVDIVYNGLDAWEYFKVEKYDSIILDIMMPKMNGIEVLKKIRKAGSTVPIMMLSAKSEIEDRVEGLEGGADDYLPKPFATAEFLARVKALTRRSNSDFINNIMHFGSVTLNRNTYELSCNDTIVCLNNKEYQLLELFFRHPHFVFSTENLMDNVWGPDSEAYIDVVWAYISFIRKKLKEINADIQIKTIRGAGYSLEEIK